MFLGCCGVTGGGVIITLGASIWGHVHTLRGRGVVRVLQGEQRLELLLLEQTSDRLLLRRWRRRRGGWG